MLHPESTESADKEFAQALAALAAEDTLKALSHMERALQLRDFPGWYSFLGFCIAKERGQQRKGLELCLKSLEEEPDNPVHFFNLAQVHLASGDKVAAIQVLREGMAKGGSPELVKLLERLGKRNQPFFPMLSRSNPLNRFLGILLRRLGLR
jgi:predicted Zn-dependent protease